LVHSVYPTQHRGLLGRMGFGKIFEVFRSKVYKHLQLSATNGLYDEALV